MFLRFVLALARKHDANHEAAIKTSIETCRDEQERDRLLASARDLGSATRTFTFFEQFLMESWLIRQIDNYLAYVSDLLTSIFRHRRETLKSNEQITMEEVLEFSSIDELVHAQAEKTVHRLSYKGLPDLSAYMTTGLGFPMFSDTAEMQRARAFVEIRNLLTHNRGKVDRVFIERLPQYAAELGQRISLKNEEIVDGVGLFSRSVRELEVLAAQKFGLDQNVSNDVLKQRLAMQELETR